MAQKRNSSSSDAENIVDNFQRTKRHKRVDVSPRTLRSRAEFFEKSLLSAAAQNMDDSSVQEIAELLLKYSKSFQIVVSKLLQHEDKNKFTKIVDSITQSNISATDMVCLVNWTGVTERRARKITNNRRFKTPSRYSVEKENKRCLFVAFLPFSNLITLIRNFWFDVIELFILFHFISFVPVILLRSIRHMRIFVIELR
jgi:hypothetical protein